MTYFPGLPDDQFIRGNVPMTKQEIRTMILAKAKIMPDDVIIDIGAGTGSISVEAALLARQGKVFSIEKATAGLDLIAANAQKFGVHNITIIPGTAPAAMNGISAANVVIVGGSGGCLGEILTAGDQILAAGGRLIISAVTIETVAEALSIMQRYDIYTVDAFCMQISRINKIGSKNMLHALNPVYIIVCIKGGAHESVR